MGIPLSMFDSYFSSYDLSLYMEYDTNHKRIYDFEKYHAALISYVISRVNGDEKALFEDFILQNDDVKMDDALEQDTETMLRNFKTVANI